MECPQSLNWPDAIAMIGVMLTICSAALGALWIIYRHR